MTKAVTFFGLVLAVLIWGASIISIDIVLEDLTVSELNITRFTITNVLLWLIQWLRPGRIKIQMKDLPLVAVAGIFGTAGYYYFENLSLTLVSPSVVHVVTGAIPITTLIIAILLFGKKTKFRNIFFVLLSFLGIFILMNPFSGAETFHFKGIGIVMIANVFWSLYTLFNETLNRKYDLLQLLTVQYTAGMFAFYGFYMYELSSKPDVQMLLVKEITLTPTLVGHMIFISVFASMGAYLLYNYALTHIGVMISALFINVVPVVTLIISVGMGLDTLTFNKVMGSLLVLVAIFFIEDI